ncbi:MAG: hypothetical protein ACK4RS_04225, partial [Thiothrix sp.]
ATIKETQFYSEFPTTGSAFEDLPLLAAEVMVSLDDTLATLNKLLGNLRLDSTVENFNDVLLEIQQTMRTAKYLLTTVQQTTLPNVTADISQVTTDVSRTLHKVEGSLAHIDHLTAQHSPTQYQLQEMLEEVTATARALRSLTETLQRQPASLLRGKQGE